MNELLKQRWGGNTPPVQKWTPLAIKRACGDKWPVVKGALEANGLYEDFSLAQELREDDPAFQRGVAWAKAEYGEEVVEAVLAEAAPKDKEGE